MNRKFVPGAVFRRAKNALPDLPLGLVLLGAADESPTFGLFAVVDGFDPFDRGDRETHTYSYGTVAGNYHVVYSPIVDAPQPSLLSAKIPAPKSDDTELLDFAEGLDGVTLQLKIPTTEDTYSVDLRIGDNRSRLPLRDAIRSLREIYGRYFH